MKTYDMIVIGFGKAGKTLASHFARQGKHIAMIEKDENMYGGACINTACIPTKTLIHAVESGSTFAEAYTYRDEVTAKLRTKNYQKLAGEDTIDIYDGEAKFTDNKVVKVTTANNEIDLAAKTIIINTGTLPFMPPIEGIETTDNVHDSTSLQSQREQPEILGIIGAGNIGLEFASLYTQMGSRVYLFNRDSGILSSEEPELAVLAVKYLEEDGVEIVSDFDITKLFNNEDSQVVVESNDINYIVDDVLVATGRRPNLVNLGIENTDIQMSDNGYIKVNEYLETSVSGVYAVGDINGGPQFTYISLDDFRIVRAHLEGNNKYNLSNRKNIPFTYFLNPPFARIGLTESKASEKGYKIKINNLDVANMPKAHVNNDLRGRFKLIINKENNLILGASLFGQASDELINYIKMAMDNDIPYTYIRDQIYIHPSMAENFNNLFDI
ncbi:MAG TPA: FAD-containing oxidoreductase [Clostridiaceae bacterium]|nr:FAD-containing oxidoreductase [Clostridiaceae bacterium]